MKKKEPPLTELIAYTTEKEKAILKRFIVVDIVFLVFSFFIEFLAEEILKLGILKWSHYWILVGSNIVLFSLITLALVRNYKIWLLKYLIAIYFPLMLIGWMYFVNPTYSSAIFGGIVASPFGVGLMFYDLKISLLSALIGAISYGLVILHYLKIGFQIDGYEIALNYLIFFIACGALYSFLPRIRMFLVELIEKRREIEEAKTVLEIKVAARTRELKELAESLDQQVKERTKELQEKLEELEKFQKLTVGRELKMVELKEEIERLKKELEETKKERSKVFKSD